MTATSVAVQRNSTAIMMQRHHHVHELERHVGARLHGQLLVALALAIHRDGPHDQPQRDDADVMMRGEPRIVPQVDDATGVIRDAGLTGKTVGFSLAGTARKQGRCPSDEDGGAQASKRYWGRGSHACILSRDTVMACKGPGFISMRVVPRPFPSRVSDALACGFCRRMGGSCPSRDRIAQARAASSTALARPSRRSWGPARNRCTSPQSIHFAFERVIAGIARSAARPAPHRGERDRARRPRQRRDHTRASRGRDRSTSTRQGTSTSTRSRPP